MATVNDNRLVSNRSTEVKPFDMEAFRNQLASGPTSQVTSNRGQATNTGQFQGPTIPTITAQAPLPVNKLNQERTDLVKTQQNIDDLNQISTNSVSEANSISGRPDEVIPTPEETPEPTSFRDQASSFLTGKLDGSDKASREDARAIKAEELQLQAKAAESNAVLNEIRTARLDFEDQIERLDRNTGGRSRIANTGRKNELTREYNRNAARQSLRYNVLQGRTTEAQNTIDTYMKDIAADQANQLSIFKTLMDFANDDMTESEKLQAQQAFSEKQAAQSFQNQKDLAQFKASIEVAKEPSFKPAEFAAATFSQRIADSEDVLLGGRGRFVPGIPNFLKTDERKQFEQAEKNFITAVLRRESGAAISAEEFADARVVYIPQASDDQTTLDNKARARAVIQAGLLNEAGGATDLLQDRLSIQDTLPAPSSGTTSGGMKYTVKKP